MKIYILNLESDKNRFEHATREFEKNGLSYERLVAIDGRTMSGTEIASYLAYPAAGSYNLSASQVGCYLSHLHAWQLFLTTNEPLAAIFEDDVHLGDGIRDILESAGDWLPVDADILKLETSLQMVALPADAACEIYGRKITKLSGRHLGSAGYLLTRKGAQKLIDNSEKLAVGVDAMMFSPRSDVVAKPTSYQIEPAICVQDDIADQCGLASHSRFQSNNVPGSKKSYGATPLQRLTYRIRDRLKMYSLKLMNVIYGHRKRVVPFR